jgi:hypothetical protein
VQVRGRGVAWSHRISEFLPAAMANSGEESGWPGGAVGSGTRGEMVRRARGFICWTRCSNYCQETGGIKRGNGGSFGFQGERGRWRG